MLDTTELRAALPDRLPELAPRDHQVLSLLATHEVRAVARMTRINQDTIGRVITRATTAIGARNRTHAVVMTLLLSTALGASAPPRYLPLAADGRHSSEAPAIPSASRTGSPPWRRRDRPPPAEHGPIVSDPWHTALFDPQQPYQYEELEPFTGSCGICCDTPTRPRRAAYGGTPAPALTYDERSPV
ncbi:hypothetical protein MCM47_15375 [Kitasatospora sp. A2-31]|nr:hypothetical protein [Kitasatospora sp. A2-31]